MFYLFFVSLLALLMPFEVFFGFLLVSVLVYISSMSTLGDTYDKMLALGQSYECGFEYGMSGCGFSLQFYVISFSFLLFDLEICLFTPLIVSMSVSAATLFSGFIFLAFVFIIFLYEVLVGAFNW